ncbi:MAG: permease prefix domain 1-containing protein [Oscillospiraceae bacterium]|nr:permease prefix domain 1-containing protein [Oscillospiraceae bacterium]
MEDKLRRYVDGLFARTVQTKKAVELKEEMLQNMEDKYNDLMSEGKAPEAAYNIVVAGVGDVGDLLSELEVEAPDSPEYAIFEMARRKSAMFTAIAVMAYILSVVPLIVLNLYGSSMAARLGVPIMLVIIAAATGLLVFNNITKPRYVRGSATMVQEFREWQSGESSLKSLRRAISSALWTIIVALYFILSFWTSAWHLTWIIFIIGAAVEAVINIFFTLKK